MPPNALPVDITDVEKAMSKLKCKEKLDIKEARVVQLLDISEVQIFNIALA